jgi:hypothetical protein
MHDRGTYTLAGAGRIENDRTACAVSNEAQAADVAGELNNGSIRAVADGQRIG